MSVTNSGRGTSVEMEPCTLNAHQGWVYEPVSSLAVRIRSQDGDAAGRCLTAHAEGVRVTMDRCAPASSPVFDQQKWGVRYASGSWNQYESYGLPVSPFPDYEYQCLDVRANGESPVVQTWLCGPSNKGNQMWKFW